MVTRVCAVDGCAGPVRAKGWCNKHYRRWRRTGDPLKVAWERGDHAANFWSKVRRSSDDGCWRWGGYVTGDGYGKFIWPGGQLAHRFAYELQVEPLAEGMDLDHRCHSESDCTATGKSCPHRRCVNVAHLQPISVSDHRSISKPGARGKAQGLRMLAKTHCPRGHAYDEANTYIDKSGSRNCRACRRKPKPEE